MFGFFRNNLEKVLFMAFAVLLGLFILFHQNFSPTPLHELRLGGEMPSTPAIVPWQVADFLITRSEQVKGDPFRVVLAFPPEEPPAPKKPEQKPEPKSAPLPPPPPDTVTIRTTGFFSSLGGLKYVILELDDSKDGRYSVTCSEGEEILPGFTVERATSDFTIISTPNGEKVRINWNDSQKFQRERR